MKKASEWWKNAVIYQIYPRSFCDSNNDGIGDIPGIITKLDYLEKLGVDAVWLSPVFCSPQADNGYDVSDYTDIDPIFGSMEDCEKLIDEAGKRGIRIIMDLVLNHSSDEHRWFLEAKKSRDNPYHDYYIWRDARDSDPSENLQEFGNSSWQTVSELGQDYYYQFSVKQPDLNWKNPKLRHELYDMIRFWTDKGVGGFRIDVVDHLGKDPDLGVNVNGPMLHEYIREMSEKVFQNPGLVTVGEAWSATPENAKMYSAPDGSELSMVFQFEHIVLDQAENGDKWDLAPLPFLKFKQVFCEWQTKLHGAGWNSLFWENHDLPRAVSRWCDDGIYRKESAKMLAILLFGMEGTPYIYQGQELGMTNLRCDLDEYVDIETTQMIAKHRARGWSDKDILRAAQAKCRDNARTPMQWNTEKNAGFTDGKPWFPVNPNYLEINAADQVGQKDSVFSCYQNLIRLRKSRSVFRDGTFELLLPDHEQIFAYTRATSDEKLLVLCNFYGKTIADPLLKTEQGGKLLISNYPDVKGILRPYEARMVILKNI